jgi:hypothetical protein
MPKESTFVSKKSLNKMPSTEMFHGGETIMRPEDSSPTIEKEKHADVAKKDKSDLRRADGARKQPLSVINSGDFLPAKIKSSDVTSAVDETEDHRGHLRADVEDPFVLNLSPSKLTYMNKADADKESMLEDVIKGKIKPFVEEIEPLTTEELILKMQNPEIFLYHMLIKKMGKNKAAKTIEDN